MNKYSKAEIVEMLSTKGEERKALFELSAKVKAENVGRYTYLRGLIEYSNRCRKNCLYCGIRGDNNLVERYMLSDQEVLDAARFALDNNYGSVVLQAGELTSPKHIDTIERLISEIKSLSAGQLGITLSLGEQTKETYQRWFEAGAHRYLLRIETSNADLYRKIHPADDNHDPRIRMRSLEYLREVGYQVGTGVMIGLPFQTVSDLADDILFFNDFDIDMCGMGPYIEHHDTPLYEFRDQLQPLAWRFDMALKMVATLRITMPDINIAATTALQTIDKLGREKAIRIGANIIMPNITPGMVRNSYKLYDNKPCTDESAEDCAGCIDNRILIAGDEVGYSAWGDSPHFAKKGVKNEM